jgi:hypothetical protein
MILFPRLEGVLRFGRQWWRIEYYSDCRSVGLNNFHGISASLPRRPDGPGNVCLGYRGGATGHG